MGFLNLEPLLSSIQSILNDYLPAVYLIAFVLLVVATMSDSGAALLRNSSAEAQVRASNPLERNNRSMARLKLASSSTTAMLCPVELRLRVPPTGLGQQSGVGG
jgi:hypothetical protein